MEIPFNYIILSIINMLNERNMNLDIRIDDISSFLFELINTFYLTEEEKEELDESFDLEEELDLLLSKYYKYFDYDSECISYDYDYIDELDSLIHDERLEYDEELLEDIDFIISSDSIFLDIIGVKINKKLYNYLLNLESDLEKRYILLCNIENNILVDENINKEMIINDIKKLTLTKRIMLLNMKTLLIDKEIEDITLYAKTKIDNDNEYELINLLLEDDNFSDQDILDDPIQRSIFTGEETSKFNIRDRIKFNICEEENDIKYSKIKFYMKFMDLIDEETKKTDNEFILNELFIIKYKLIYALDSIYDMALFMDNKDINIEFNEDYSFAEYEVYYFIDEVLSYEDSKYIDKEYDYTNILTYFDNLVKRIFIDTYYRVTGDKNIINYIKNNELYGINTISSDLLDYIVKKPKSKIKEK